MSVAQIAYRSRTFYIGQALCLGSLQSFCSRIYSGAVRLNTTAVFIGQTKQLIYAHNSWLGTQILTAQHGHSQRHEPSFFAHKKISKLVIELK